MKKTKTRTRNMLELIERVKNIQNMTSLAAPIGEEDGANVGDTIADKKNNQPEEIIEKLIKREEVENILTKLSEKEAKIIKLRFGIDSGYPRTLEEVGKMFNVTRERVRQIEAKAIRRLRHPSRARQLKDYDDRSGN
ncbi:MAG: sigma-70 family RNA polymerase sigma factor [Elusimicrobiaceae bacterium]|nr:sigma-70 family RNA polymerase sigma factor [Elusimicrobiaceae bacterium]